jgi:drug/metabolite transporter (DMT)-like permease
MSILSSDRTKGILMTTLGIIVASPDGLFMRLADMDPWTVIFFRGLMLAFSINLWIRLSTGRHATASWRESGRWDWILAVSFTCTGLSFLLALSMTSVANVLVMTGLAPVVTALLGARILGEKVGSSGWIAIIACILGAGIIALGEADDSASGNALTSILGIFFGFLAAAFISVQTIACRKTPHKDTRASVVAGALLASLIAAPLASPLHVEAVQIVDVGAMGVVLMPVAIILVFAGTRYINAYEVVIISLLEVVLGPLLAWLVLGEMPALHTFAGGALILLGIAFYFRPQLAARQAVSTQARAAE